LQGDIGNLAKEKTVLLFLLPYFFLQKKKGKKNKNDYWWAIYSIVSCGNNLF
jgi:hypothetical protein